MTREEKIAEAKRLRAAGGTYAAIGRLLGVSYPTIKAWTNADWYEAKKSYHRHWSKTRPDSRKRYRDQNRDMLNEYNRRWRASNRDRARATTLRSERKRKLRVEVWAKNCVWRAQRRAEKRGVPCTITWQDVLAVYPPDNRCPVFGVELKRFGGRSGSNPSLDCLVPERGYVPGNVCVISSRANAMKSDATPSELRKLLSWIENRA